MEDIIIRYTKYGYELYNRNTLVYIGLPYDEVRELKEGLAAVKKNSHWGFINEKGELVIPCIYDEVHDFSEGYAVVFSHKSNRMCKSGYVNMFGDYWENTLYEEIGDFKCGRARVVKSCDVQCFFCKPGKTDLVGFINLLSLS